MNYITIIGSTVHTAAGLELSLDVAAQGRLDVLIDQVLPLLDAARRLVAARSGVGKIVLKPW